MRVHEKQKSVDEDDEKEFILPVQTMRRPTHTRGGPQHFEVLAAMAIKDLVRIEKATESHTRPD